MDEVQVTSNSLLSALDPGIGDLTRYAGGAEVSIKLTVGALREIIAIVERSAHEPRPVHAEDCRCVGSVGPNPACPVHGVHGASQPQRARRRPTLEESNAWASAEEERDWWRDYALEIEGAAQPRAAECSDCNEYLTERDRAQDALQETHIALGGDGEWTGKLPPQPAPDSGDLHLDVPELARERMAELERLRAAPPPVPEVRFKPTEWSALSDRLPTEGLLVALANVDRFRSDDQLGCIKDIGVLKNGGHDRYWSTHGQLRAMCLEAFTHWSEILEPCSDSTKGVAP